MIMPGPGHDTRLPAPEHTTRRISDQDTATLYDEQPNMLEAFGAERSLFTTD